jgi:hypothetical protein
VIFESVVRALQQSIDSTPERMFHLMSGMVLITIGLRLRGSFE